MTIHFIDHALNVVLTGLLYGSEAWIVAAFGFYIATHERPIPSVLGARVAKDVTPDAVKDIAVETVGAIATAQADDEVVKDPVVEVVASTPILTYPTEPAEIVCEPVNWKKWKVGDLRKASLATVCGVRTRPIGSRRNLSKADLIAQYEQQLKRFTKVPARQKTVKRKRTIA